MITFAPAIRFLVLSSVLLAAHTAHATMTCAVPPTSPAGHSYYVDPVNGSMANDGSSSAPWSNLQAVLNSGLVASLYYKTYVTGASLSGPHPNAVVEAGDTIHLRSGNYGAIKVANAYNDGFVTIAAETGQTPVFSSLVVEGAAKWIFQGITVQNSNAKTLASALVLINGLSWEGPTTDIIVQNNNIMADSTATVAGWTLADWTARAAGAAVATRGVCTTIQNNYIHNVRTGVTIYLASQATVHGNVINNFTDDGIDINGSDVTVTRNKITNHHWVANGVHPDCIQGQSLAASLGTAYTAVNKNILIDSNVCIRHTDSTLSDNAGDYLQGITVFDGHWENWTVTNNVIVTNAWCGISTYGVNTATIVNNTVLGTNPAVTTWIDAEPMKAYQGGDLPVANVIRNNIAMRYTNDGPQKTAMSGVTLDHNVIATETGQLYQVETTKNTAVGPGTNYPNLLAQSIQQMFVTFVPATLLYDLHLASGSSAIGAGSMTLAPTRDLDSVIRRAPVNNGAYGLAP